VFQLILPFQLELPFDGPEAARGTPGAARVRRARVRGRKGRPLQELGQGSAAPSAEAE
jgi:hypothetical protein